tara:strand:+ start:788 stop:973 length:186 start_codon:yes stop_codon:yes gene_type:complete
MENKTEYIMIKQITKKENRKNLIKIVGGGFLFAILGIASMYFFLFFMLWANEITDKVIGYF